MMVQSHVWIGGSSLKSHLKPVLQSWVEGLDRYSRLVRDQDAMYGYNERTNLGVLSGALWKSGNMALEEYQITKKVAPGTTRFGRADLWFRCNRTDYVAEAKRMPANLAPARMKYLLPDIKTRLAAAVAEVKTDIEPAKTRLGLLFVVPFVSTKRKGQLPSLLDNFVETCERVKLDAIAFYFTHPSRYPEWAGRVHPGVVLMVRRSAG